MAKSKYRRLVDLYVTGTEFVFPDGTPAWLQVLNPFERDVIRKEAQIARARVVLAMREHGSDEQNRVRAGFLAGGPEQAVEHLAESELTRGIGKVMDSIRNDPEWAERMEIIDRGLDDTARRATPEEDALVAKLETDYLGEITKRAESEREFLTRKYGEMDEATLWQAFLESWLDRLGDEAAMQEFRVSNIAYAARVCEGVQVEGKWDHSACGGHDERIWETVAEIRALPEPLVQSLEGALVEIEMAEREAKNSDRQMSSSGSSQLPSEEGASTPSTPIETPAEPHGTSLPQSATP